LEGERGEKGEVKVREESGGTEIETKRGVHGIGEGRCGGERKGRTGVIGG